MAAYKKMKVTRRGKEGIMYFKDKKLISQKNAPGQLLESDQFNVTIDIPEDGDTSQQPEQTQEQVAEEDEADERPERKCVFCGQQGTQEKFVNLQTVYLCKEDYDNHTTGEIVAKLRENQNEKLSQEEERQEV